MKDRISNLKTQLIAEYPFFGILLANIDIIKENIYPTAATDGIRIYYNDIFFNLLTDQEVKGILLHEILHIIYAHCNKTRRGFREPKRWNYAIDYAINWEIKAMDPDKVRLPKNILIEEKKYNILYDPQYKDMYAEDIYDKLNNQLCNEDVIDIHIDKILDDAARQEIEDKILSSYEIVYMEKKAISPSIRRIVDEIKKSRVPWTRVLHRYIGSAFDRSDYSYNTFNRRFLPQNLYLPGLRNNKLNTVAVAIDTSASIKSNMLASMQNELRKISALISRVIVISCDDKVHSFETITDMTNFNRAVNNIAGNGATDFRPPFIELSKRKIVPELVIYMTDGHGTFPDKKDVSYPVIWLMTTEKVAPFGVTIPIQL